MLSEGSSIKKYLLLASYKWDSNIDLPIDENNIDNNDEWKEELYLYDDVSDFLARKN